MVHTGAALRAAQQLRGSAMHRVCRACAGMLRAQTADIQRRSSGQQPPHSTPGAMLLLPAHTHIGSGGSSHAACPSAAGGVPMQTNADACLRSQSNVAVRPHQQRGHGALALGQAAQSSVSGM